MRTVRLVALIACVTSLAAGTNVAQAQARVASRASSDSAFLIRPGDVVRLRIWREPDLSGEFPVDLSGTVVFPKIGPIAASTMTPDSLKSDLIHQYQVYLNNPSIEFVFLRRINVLGAVRLPGLYPVDPTMTLSDVIAAAGGPTPIGEPDKAQLIRDGHTIDAALTRETRVSDIQLRSGDQLFVPERSWFTRNSGVVAAALTATVSLMIAFLRH